MPCPASMPDVNQVALFAHLSSIFGAKISVMSAAILPADVKSAISTNKEATNGDFGRVRGMEQMTYVGIKTDYS